MEEATVMPEPGGHVMNSAVGESAPEVVTQAVPQMVPATQVAPAVSAAPAEAVVQPGLLEIMGFGFAEKLLADGGPIVAILLVLSVFVVAIILVKFWQFIWVGVNRRGKAQHALDIWLSGDQQKALQVVRNNRNPVGDVLAHGMRGLMNRPDEMELVREDVERVAQEKLSSARSFLRAIEAVVQVAPLLGLFGTVLGMIQAFTALQSAGAEADPAVLAGGISVALLTTAVGLAVAIPAALALHWFEGGVDRLGENIETMLTSLFTGRLTEENAPLQHTISAPSLKQSSLPTSMQEGLGLAVVSHAD